MADLTRPTFYEPDQRGVALVVDVHHVFDEYDPETGGKELHSRVVRYAPDREGYSPMPGTPPGDLD